MVRREKVGFLSFLMFSGGGGRFMDALQRCDALQNTPIAPIPSD